MAWLQLDGATLCVIVEPKANMHMDELLLMWLNMIIVLEVYHSIGIDFCRSFVPTRNWSSARQPFVCKAIAAPVARKESALSRTTLLRPFL